MPSITSRNRGTSSGLVRYSGDLGPVEPGRVAAGHDPGQPRPLRLGLGQREQGHERGHDAELEAAAGQSGPVRLV
jgi:hypothetical protein